MTDSSPLPPLQKLVWDGSIALEIHLAKSDCRTYDQSDPYLIHCPRLSYIPFLLPRLHTFFSTFLIDHDVSAYDGWFSYDDVPLKWHFPIGLLYDLFSGAVPSTANAPVGHKSEPWNLTLHFSNWPEQLVGLDAEGRILHDAFINNVKEADFLRNGTAKAVMSLSKDDSIKLWKAVENHNVQSYNSVHSKLLNHPGSELRHCPIKIYLPRAAQEEDKGEEGSHASLRVIQAPVSPRIDTGHLQTIGTALNTIIPSIFPSRRNHVLALPVLHGAVLPMNAVLADLIREATYADGFIHVGIIMMS